MAQLTIKTYDNDRLKNRKVRAMLEELEVWPTEPGARPNFLRGHRTAGILIDRALANVAPVAEPLARFTLAAWLIGIAAGLILSAMPRIEVE